MKAGIKVKFWGVRGSIPTPGKKYIKYGGNTPCIEMKLPDDKLFIFDAGTGIRELGDVLSWNERRLKTHIFLSHFHWDHIQGLPFFRPSYIKGNEIIILGMDTPEAKLEDIISNQMESITFPVQLQSLKAHIQFQRLSEGSNVIDGINVDTIYLNHPGQALGYVITSGDAKICYLTDNELVPTWVNETAKLKYKSNTKEKILKAISGANLLIHDAQFTDEEYKTRVGWGHSSLNEVMKLAKEGRVKKLALFHYDPDHFDEHIDILVANCNGYLNSTNHHVECFAAQEGMELHF